MISTATLWIPFTVTAALGQVARNAMQRQLTGPLGTWGATNIRFLFGFPFSIVFFAVVVTVSGDHVPWPTAAFWPWLLLGALSQIVATGLMLLAMNDRSFVVTTAYLKTEAIQTAIFGFVFLGDHLTTLKVIAILIATIGVVITALRPGGKKSFALAIVGAEYVLRWLPRGTHQWDKFVTPDELAQHLANNKLTITEQAGVVYSPLADKWSISSDTDVNYMVVAEGV